MYGSTAAGRIRRAFIVIAAVLAASGCSPSGDDESRIEEQDLAYELPAEYADIFAGDEYAQPGDIARTVPNGHTLMDFWADFIREDCLETTFDSIQRSGADRIVYFNWASYRDVSESANAPTFGYLSGGDAYSFRSATAAEIRQMAAEARSRGLDFVLGLELNYDLAYLEGPGADGWNRSEYLAFVDDTIAWLNQTGDAVEANPSDPFAAPYWERWFAAYRDFLLAQAQIAQAENIETLVIGKQLAGAVRNANEQRWRDLIADLRAVYGGRIAYAGIITGDVAGTLHHEAQRFPVDALDAVVLVPWAAIHGDDRPSMSELIDRFATMHDSVLTALTGSPTGTPATPVVYLTPFQSFRGAPRQTWFEPADVTHPELEQDLLIQAMMYEAFFRSIEDRNWADEVWSWGYWWRNRGDTMYRYGDSSFDKAPSVRNKPAIEIMRKWGGGS